MSQNSISSRYENVRFGYQLWIQRSSYGVYMGFNEVSEVPSPVQFKTMIFLLRISLFFTFFLIAMM